MVSFADTMVSRIRTDRIVSIRRTQFCASTFRACLSDRIVSLTVSRILSDRITVRIVSRIWTDSVTDTLADRIMCSVVPEILLDSPAGSILSIIWTDRIVVRIVCPKMSVKQARFLSSRIMTRETDRIRVRNQAL